MLFDKRVDAIAASATRRALFRFADAVARYACLPDALAR